MSASSKKKLRNAQEAELLTEKQQAERKEAKKLKAMTIAMVLVVAVMVVFAVSTAIYNGVIGSGKLQRGTVAATVGDHEINAVEFNCFYVDAISNFYSQVGSYAALYGLDVSAPLDEQVYDEEEGTTWADYFITTAEENAKSVYAIVDEAKANGFTLTEEDEKYIDTQMSSMALYSVYYGYSDVDSYLEAMYGTGANEETVRAYFETCYTAEQYQNSVAEAQEYTADDIQAKDDEDPNAYSTFSYNSYYLSASKFLEGGTTDDEGNTTYSDEEKAASITAAEEAAKSLTGEDITSVEKLDAAIAALKINAEAASAASSPYEDYSYSYIASAIKDWVADESRQAGDLTYLPSTTTDAEGNESVAGYYVVYFVERNDNEIPLQNVRHILFQFQGGTTDTNGTTTYSDEEKAAALEKAEALYEEWKSGDATEDSFAELANKNSADSDGTDGGLYTDIYPGQMVEAFNDWCFDEARQTGDTEIVETEYGYHIMYYVSATDYTYREYMIENTLLNEYLQEWLDALVAEVTLTAGNHKYVPTGMVLNNG